MAKHESGRLMLESEIPAFVDAVIEAGCDICDRPPLLRARRPRGDDRSSERLKAAARRHSL